MQRAALGVGQCRREQLTRALDRRTDRARLGRARVHDHGVGANRVADAQRVRQRRQRLAADLRVIGGAVDEVDGVDHHGADVACRLGFAETLEVLRPVVGRPPGARRLVEDLDRPRAQFAAALDSSVEPTRG